MGVMFIIILSIAFIVLPFTLITVDSESMEPSIEPVSDISLINTNDQYPEKGNIITYRSATLDKKITHRVMSVEENGFITKGDNNLKTDQEAGEPLVNPDRIVGTVVEFSSEPLIIPNIGYLSVLFTEYRELILTLLLVSFILDSASRIGRDPTINQSIKLLSITCIILILIWSTFVLTSLDTTGHDSIEVVGDPDPGDPSQIAVGEKAMIEIELQQVFLPYPTHKEVEVIVDERDIVGDSNVSYSTITNKGTVKYTVETERFDKEVVYSVRSVRHVYPHTLPSPIISVLHNIHPLLASLFTVGVVGILPLVLFGTAILIWNLLERFGYLRSLEISENDED